jgi:hypothetical protein
METLRCGRKGNDRPPRDGAMCDLATQDDEVISAHARNHTITGGRHNTRFRTAFMVQTPVRPERIIEISTADGETELPAADVTLDDMSGRRLPHGTLGRDNPAPARWKNDDG